MSDAKIPSINLKLPGAPSFGQMHAGAKSAPSQDANAAPALSGPVHSNSGQGVAKSAPANSTSNPASASVASLNTAAKADRQSLQKQDQAVQAAVKKLNDYVQSHRRELKFSVDKSTGKTVIDVVDQHSGKVVRQIPDELALKLARDLQQNEPLSLFKAKI